MFLKRSSKRVIAGSFLFMAIIFLLFVPQSSYAEQVNGEYTIGFNIMHADQKNASIAEGYWNQPAKVFIQDGRIRVQTTINKHAWVTKFATSYNGTMSEVKTIAVDAEANTRVTEFPVANFTDLVESQVSVTVDDINYEHSYTMYFKFKPETLTLVKAEEVEPPDVSGGSEEHEGSEEPEPAIEDTQKVTPAPAEEKDPAGVAGPDEEEAAVETPAVPVTRDEPSDNDAVEQAPSDVSDVDTGQQSDDAVGPDNDSAESSVMENSAASNEAPAEQTTKEDSQKNMIVIALGLVIVFIAIIAMVAYRQRRSRQ